MKKDHEWRQKTIVEYAFLVKQICAKFAVRLPSSVMFEELLSAGSLGLIDAVDKFDPEHHASLKTYAKYRITGSIIDELRSMDTYSRSMRDKIKRIENATFRVEKMKKSPATDQEIADALEIPLEDYQNMLTRLHGAAILSLDEFITNNRKNDFSSKTRFASGLKDERTPDDSFFKEEFKHLLAKEIETLNKKEQLVVSLYYYEDLTLKEIGEVLSLTEARICQIHSSVLVKLKSKLKNLQPEKR